MRVGPGMAGSLGKLGNCVGTGIALALIAVMGGMLVADIFLSIIRAHF